MVRNYVRKTEAYKKEDMEEAVKLVLDGAMGYKKAAKLFGLNSRTVRDHVKNPSIKMGAGKPTTLTSTEEEELASCLQMLSESGFEMTRKETQEVVGEYIKCIGRCSSFVGGLPGEDWMAGFLKRHPDLKRHDPEKMKVSRPKSPANEAIYDAWFNLLQQTCVEHNLPEKPNRIYSADESSFPLPQRFRMFGIMPLDQTTIPESVSTRAKLFDGPNPNTSSKSLSSIPSNSVETSPPSCLLSTSNTPSSSVPSSLSFSATPSPSVEPSPLNLSSTSTASSSSVTPSPGPSSSTPSIISFQTVPPHQPTIKDFFLRRLIPLMSKSNNSSRAKAMKRQYGESFTSEEYLQRLEQEVREKVAKMGKGKGKGKKTFPATITSPPMHPSDNDMEDKSDNSKDSDCDPD